MSKYYDRILGAFLGSGMGDCLGAPTETRPTYLIKKDIGGGNYTFDYTIPLPTTLVGEYPPAMRKGIATDDISVSYISSLEFIKDGAITAEGAKRGLLEWAKYPEYFIPHSGPSTREAIAKIVGYYALENNKPYVEYDGSKGSYVLNKASTNGAGMKAFVAGVFNPENPDKAIDDLIVYAGITHPNRVALSAGSAVAAATSAAMSENSTLDKVIDAGLYGAREGYKRASKIYPSVTGSDVVERMKQAIGIGLKYSDDFDRCIKEMNDLIGLGIRATEAIPAGFGFMVAAAGDTLKAIHLAMNAGDDTDTVGAIAGSMCGAFQGFSHITDAQYHLNIISKANNFDLCGVATKISKITEGK
jgi:ADP-ribosylglycohydrolase